MPCLFIGGTEVCKLLVEHQDRDRIRVSVIRLGRFRNPCLFLFCHLWSFRSSISQFSREVVMGSVECLGRSVLALRQWGC